MKKINIAIDGLSATGKGETTKSLAKQLNYKLLDSGAMYRGLTWDLKRKNIRPEDVTELDLGSTHIGFGENGHLYVNGEDVEHNIRTENISKLTPQYAKQKIIRYYINKELKELVKERGYIAEGRDIANNIMPDAEIKLFLVGDSEIRAKRRQEQLKKKGILENVETIKIDLESRDHADMNRDIAPLVKHREAIEIDTTQISMDEQNEFIHSIIQKYLGK